MLLKSEILFHMFVQNSINVRFRLLWKRHYLVKFFLIFQRITIIEHMIHIWNGNSRQVANRGGNKKKNNFQFQSMNIKIELMWSSYNRSRVEISERWKIELPHPHTDSLSNGGWNEKVFSIQVFLCFVMEKENFIFRLHHTSHTLTATHIIHNRSLLI